MISSVRSELEHNSIPLILSILANLRTIFLITPIRSDILPNFFLQRLSYTWASIGEFAKLHPMLSPV
jgi:hypothetical protein